MASSPEGQGTLTNILRNPKVLLGITQLNMVLQHTEFNDVLQEKRHLKCMFPLTLIPVTEQ